MQYRYDLRIAGIHIRILAPREIQLPENMRPFRFIPGADSTPAQNVEIFFGTDAPLPEEDGWRVERTPSGGAQDFVRMERAGRIHSCRLGIPADMADGYCESGNWLRLLALERLMLPFGRVILHASAVRWQGRGIVFTAPSGTGKSTQAAIWEQAFGAEVLNGDKVILSADETGCIAYGGPAAGSSGIYKNESAPVAAIIRLRQGSENILAPMKKTQGYLELYSGMVKSARDPTFNAALLPVIENILDSVPILTLSCTPDVSAAECVKRWIEACARQA